MYVLVQVIIYMCHIIINAQNDNIVSNDYAEVRVLLDKYYQIKARKHGHYHDYDSKKVNKELKDIPTDDGTEASINRKEGVVGDLFENDILLTLPQVKALLNEDIKSRSNRQAIRGAHYNWINMPISYRFANSDAKWQKVIRNALQHIETETCVRFEENGANQNYLYFTKGRGCWSNVGKIGGRQLISIGIGCELVGIVAHEVLHALGLWHEQSRSDRDNSIWINYFNIYPGTQGNFEKRTILDSDNMGLPYDFGSIMHYGSKAFTTDHKRYTIETRDRRYQETIGQRQMISFKDARMINLRYCGTSCRHQMTCYNGGYTDPNNCYQCKCPSGLGGANCLSVEKSTDYDYRDIAFAGVRDNVHCIWRIRSNRRILVKVDELRLPCRETCDSYLELKYKADMIPTDGNRTDRHLITTTTSSSTSTTTTMTKTTTKKMTTATITTKPRRTTKAKSAWSNWGAWSSCSVTCGGCGKQRRIRACYGSDRICPGPNEEAKRCGEKRCKIQGKFDCTARLVMPCSLYHKLQFGTNKDAHVLVSDKFATYPYKEKQYLKSVFAGEKLCEKHLRYLCSTPTLTVYLGQITRNNLLSSDKRGCCDEYHYNGTICIQDGNIFP